MIPSHPNQRFFIGGYSPHVHHLDPCVLESGVVIGVNEFPRLGYKLDYWLCCDTDSAMRLFPELVRSIQAPRFMQQYDHVPDAPADYWFKRERECIPTQWDERLSWSSTSACAAVNLACLMGAKEVFLFGVDLTTGGRADGSHYENDAEHWTRWVAPVNKWLHECASLFGVAIYKMNPDSPLSLPYHDASTQ